MKGREDAAFELDVEMLAALFETGALVGNLQVATAETESMTLALAVLIARDTAGSEMPHDAATSPPTAAVVRSTHSQLESIRETLFHPLIEQNERQQVTITEQAKTLGRVTAKRGELKRQVGELRQTATAMPATAEPETSISSDSASDSDTSHETSTDSGNASNLGGSQKTAQEHPRWPLLRRILRLDS